MRENQIKDALSVLEEIKALLKKETELGLRSAKAEFLIWGLYQFTSSLIVYFSRDYRYFYLLLPFFFLLDTFKWTRWTAFFYWVLSFVAYVLLLNSDFTYWSFALLSVIMIFGLFFNMRRATKNTRFALMPILWAYILFFNVLLTFACIKSNGLDLLYILWPGIIAFSLGLWGLFSEKFLLVFSVITNVAAFIGFMLLKGAALTLTLMVYGIAYVIFYVYLEIKLKMD